MPQFVTSVLKYCTGVGAVEHKLFVGSLNKQASEKEIEEVRFIIGLSYTLFW